ncbi:MAG: hypothetical protein WAM28_05090 [Chlamydiales bacterium]
MSTITNPDSILFSQICNRIEEAYKESYSGKLEEKASDLKKMIASYQEIHSLFSKRLADLMSQKRQYCNDANKLRKNTTKAEQLRAKIRTTDNLSVSHQNRIDEVSSMISRLEEELCFVSKKIKSSKDNTLHLKSLEDDIKRLKESESEINEQIDAIKVRQSFTKDQFLKSVLQDKISKLQKQKEELAIVIGKVNDRIEAFTSGTIDG